MENMTREESTALRSALDDTHTYSKELVEKSLRSRFEAEARSAPIADFQMRKGTLCLSETHDNALMWAHYASDHRGYAIEIDSARCI